jgi:hypothetical protein
MDAGVPWHAGLRGEFRKTSNENSRLNPVPGSDIDAGPHRFTVSFFAFNGSILNSARPLTRRTLPMVITDVESLKQRINQLHIEHRDLDDVIFRLSQSPAQDQLQLQRLKKRKLYLKDQIAMLERQLTPDIPA